MDSQPKTEHASPPIPASSSSHGSLNDMSFSELVSDFRASYHKFEEVLVAKHKAEIDSLAVKYEMERLQRLHTEDQLKKKEQQLLDDRNAIAALRIRCCKLEDENKKNLETIQKLKDENCILENEKCNANAKLLNEVAVPDSPPLKKRKKGVRHCNGESSGMMVKKAVATKGEKNSKSPEVQLPWIKYWNGKKLQDRIHLEIRDAAVYITDSSSFKKLVQELTGNNNNETTASAEITTLFPSPLEPLCMVDENLNSLSSIGDAETNKNSFEISSSSSLMKNKEQFNHYCDQICLEDMVFGDDKQSLENSFSYQNLESLLSDDTDPNQYFHDECYAQIEQHHVDPHDSNFKASKHHPQLPNNPLHRLPGLTTGFTVPASLSDDRTQPRRHDGREEIGHGDATAGRKSDSATRRDGTEQIENGNTTAMRRSNMVPRQGLGCRAMKNGGYRKFTAERKLGRA
ncbi:hypothetical protein PIB30_062850 [Stylosanthes scabra]|uniref:VQ domain-containing protein n=1 Tax=Stylosanthes scabra TaxID=79078 RepID=A0ABU6YIR4_9FABA|nr:hypothetical protein [Stylosanthes scabra]